MSRIVAIVGRPNVGKSTLFNRLTESRKAIVHEQEGVTRDRIYGKCFWNGIEFSVVDTGGFIKNSDDIITKEISNQVLIAIEEADVIYFMVDAQTGITQLDEDVAELLRKSSKPVILVVNKVDNVDVIYDAYETYKLGFENVYFISSINGSGTGDLLDFTVEIFKNRKDESNLSEKNLPKFAIVGRPNVGKSTLINALIGENRNIVTPIAGTTRDSIDTYYNKFGKEFILIDTAGLRRKSKEKEAVEFFSVMRTIRAIENSDVCLLLIDATEGITNQDLAIFRLIQKNHKGIVILVNKWDLIPKDSKTHLTFEKEIKDSIAPMDDVPILFISAINKQRIFQALEAAEEVYINRQRKIKTSELNSTLLEIIQTTPPPKYKNIQPKIKYITMLKTYYPSFVFFCNTPQYIKEPYKRFIENQIRKLYNFKGVPIELYFRKK